MKNLKLEHGQRNISKWKGTSHVLFWMREIKRFSSGARDHDLLLDGYILLTELAWHKRRSNKGRKFLKKLWETVVLRRWEHYKMIWFSSERRANARNVSFRTSLRWPIHIINPVDKTISSYAHPLSNRQIVDLFVKKYSCIWGHELSTLYGNVTDMMIKCWSSWLATPNPVNNTDFHLYFYFCFFLNSDIIV